MADLRAKVMLSDDAARVASDLLLNDGFFSKYNSEDYIVLPGFCDVHVHFREPGFCYKEDIYTGSFSAAKGGYTKVCTMPNLNPVPDTRKNLDIQLEAIKRSAVIDVYPIASITKGEKGEELSDMEDMADSVVGYSDDGRGVQSDEMMKEAMLRAKALGKMIVAHCEVNSLLKGGYIHDGEYAKSHGHRGICSESEYAQIARDVELLKETGTKYHVCHVSAKESVEIIRKAKADGVDITAETGPHYLVLNDSCLKEEGRFKMNPPIRSEEDRLALIEGIKDGTIDMIATDHAPHSEEEKGKGLEKSAFGIVGLETAFPILYTKLVKEGIITLEKLVELMSTNPVERFGFNDELGFSIWNIKDEYEIDPAKFYTKGRSTPFAGMKVFGKHALTYYKGKKLF